jgi:protein-S-isoprenylcysteine O-methyltransferase Ste14
MKLRIPPLLVVVVAASLMAVLARIVPDWTVESRVAGALAAVLALAGLAVLVPALGAFRRARTTVSPLEPQRASTLVVRGVYRVTRNPMYLGFAVLLLAWACWLAHPLALLGPVLFVAWMNRYQIEAEERALEARFGAGYRAYRQRVRRWL